MAAGSRGRPRHPDVLTPAEWRVLHWIRHGLSRRQAAAHLRVTEDAVRYHVRNIRAKLGVADQRDLRQWAGHPADGALGQEADMQDRTGGITGVAQLSLLIRDTGRATRFYAETLGLPHLYTYGDLVFFDCGGTRLYLHRVPAEQWRPGSIVYFRVADIEARHRELADRGVEFAGAPHLIHRHDSGVEEWLAVFADPEGNDLALLAQVHPSG